MHRDLGIKWVRFHGSFDDDVGPTVVGTYPNVSYNWSGIDALYDGILAAGCTSPIVELSYMPSAIAQGSSCGQFAYKGCAELPKSWDAWYDLVHAFARHLVQRHGLQAIKLWKWEVWNVRLHLPAMPQ